MEKNLIQLENKDGMVVVSSRVVAKDFGKRHDHVLRGIEEIMSNEGVPQNWGDLFIESQYQHPQNKQWYKEYLLTRDGFSLLVMGFTGKEALQWKLKYIEAFNKMEEMIKNQIPKITEEQMAIINVVQADSEEDRMIALSRYKKVIAKPLVEKIEHQTSVITTLTEDVDLAETRQRLNQLIRFGGGYQDKWAMLYKEFDLAYHMDTNTRYKNAKEKKEIKPNYKSRLDYIDRGLEMIPELYQIACKLFESDYNKLIETWSATIKNSK